MIDTKNLIKEVNKYWDEPEAFNPNVINAITLENDVITITNVKLWDHLGRLFQHDGRSKKLIKFKETGFAVIYKGREHNTTVRFKNTYDNRGNWIRKEVVGEGIWFEATFNSENKMVNHLKRPLVGRFNEITNKLEWYLREDNIHLMGPGTWFTEYIDSEGNELPEAIYYKVNEETGEKTLVGPCKLTFGPDSYNVNLK